MECWRMGPGNKDCRRGGPREKPRSFFPFRNQPNCLESLPMGTSLCPFQEELLGSRLLT